MNRTFVCKKCGVEKCETEFHKRKTTENLQPLWAEENLRKSSSLSEEFQPSLLLEVE